MTNQQMHIYKRVPSHIIILLYTTSLIEQVGNCSNKGFIKYTVVMYVISVRKYIQLCYFYYRIWRNYVRVHPTKNTNTFSLLYLKDNRIWYFM